MNDTEKTAFRYRLILEQSGISRRGAKATYTPKTVRERDLLQQIEKIVEDGSVIYVWSSLQGNSKADYAYELIKAYAKSQAKRSVYNALPITTVNFPELMLQMKESISSGDTEAPMKKQMLKIADLILLDEIGAKPLSEYDRTMLYDIVNYRFKEMKASIIVGSLPKKDMEKVLGKQIFDKIIKEAIEIEVK